LQVDLLAEREMTDVLQLLQDRSLSRVQPQLGGALAIVSA
jgi:hypothetical protein